jgi:glutathione peroxidase
MIAGAGPAGVEVAGQAPAGAEVAGDEMAGDEMIAGAGPAGVEVAGEAPAGAEVAGDEMIAGVEVAGEAPAGAEVAGDEMMAGEIIIEVAGEEGEEWVDPEDFGEPGEGIHAFTMDDINGEAVDMRRYRGRVTLVVNVASRCGYTRQYEDLQTLYETYRDRGLVILGFPANNFGGQEPGSDEEIAEFCSANYGVNFPMFSKISVKGGDIHPLYQYLTGESGREVSWNFNKFLVGPDGLYVSQFLSMTEPLSDELINAIEPLLATE